MKGSILDGDNQVEKEVNEANAVHQGLFDRGPSPGSHSWYHPRNRFLKTSVFDVQD